MKLNPYKCVICENSMGNSNNKLAGYSAHKKCIIDKLKENKDWIIQDELLKFKKVSR